MHTARLFVGLMVAGFVAPACTVFGELSDYEIQGSEGGTIDPGGTDTSVVDSTPPGTDTSVVDSTPPGCTRNEDCFGALGGAVPAGCAEASCDIAAGTCLYRAKDLDGDTHAGAVCAVGSFAVTLGDDCDDNNPKVHPGAWDGPKDATHEASCDGVDNDCNMTPDDGKDEIGTVCTCKRDATAECSELEAGTAITFPSGSPQGACKKGLRTCDADGKWSKCIGAVAPAAPDCTKIGDLDCDGAKDDTQLADCSTIDGCVGKRCGTAGTCTASVGTTEWGIDKDNDGYCAGKTSFCTGKAPGAGYRAVSTCISLTDDCDANPAAYRNVVVRTDADNDTHCVGTATTVCTTGGAPSGTRLTTSCVTPDDACDSTAGGWTIGSVRKDADGDAHCIGAPYNACTSGSPPAGTRAASSCVSPDEDGACDNTAGVWTTMTYRADGDGDNYCVGPSASSCTNGTPPAKTSSMCKGEDCKDTNGNANVPQRAADASQPCGYPFATGYKLSGSGTQSFRLDGGAGGVSSGGACNDCSSGGGTVCNCRTIVNGDCGAGWHLAGCWTGLTGGSCTNFIASPAGGRFFTAEVRLGVAAWGWCTGDIGCDCAAD